MAGNTYFDWGSIQNNCSRNNYKNEKLATEGVYNIVRHPLYLGSFCIALGLCFICNEILIWIYFLIFFPATYIAAIKIEEKWLKTKFKDSFEEYKKNIPAFVPLKIRKFQKKECFHGNLLLRIRNTIIG